MKYDYCVTLHAVGADLPTKFHGWEFTGASVREGDNGPFLFVRWRRSVRPQATRAWLAVSQPFGRTRATCGAPVDVAAEPPVSGPSPLREPLLMASELQDTTSTRDLYHP